MHREGSALLLRVSGCPRRSSAVALILNTILFSLILGLSVVLFLPGLAGQVKIGSVWLKVSSPAKQPAPSHGPESSSLGESSCEFCLLLSVGLQCHSIPDAVNKWVKKMFNFRIGTMINMWNLSRVCLLYLFEMQSACLLKYFPKGHHNLRNKCAGLLESR